ncbi:DegT/DnrJ/EryC1/StrS family aminotransferase [Xenorhabdus cabanillasii]|uniref:Pilin glycosylation protein PglC n=1 Tax=Xenorhabdus cabanillasii JM26 TaxID=1427517 RepID=W1J3N4_9GAMM|nr:DegT/DnrJ/EryC1/StrS aminotransferase family protein [Xenorhabdus cabanillasii]PHM77700.1 putative pyridoxal phosphate-dependent enzyme [Xenorhabdus cabanillasii JM26]CDL84441.1 Pilin glycosylation protein PglC [Xenorhabdus cabanillasii JM26]
MLNTRFSPWPSFTLEETKAVENILLSNKVNYWTGNECKTFEKEFAEFTKSKYAISLANGTVALDIALHALNIGVGDDVLVTSRTFLASASCIVNAGANPIFVDVDLNSQNVTSSTLNDALTPNAKAIIIVHLAGMPADMDEIINFANKHNIFIIEDCAQAHGAKYKGHSVGTLGHIGAWSFCQDKIMSTGGEGGMVTTNDFNLWSKMWSYKDHGKNFDTVHNQENKSGFRWLHESFGTNWRLTEMQAAIGRIQLKRLPEWLKIRSKNAKILTDALEKFDCIRVPIVPDYVQHAWYKYYVFVKPELLAESWTRDRIIEEINKLGVPCYQGSCSEVYLEKAFDNTAWRPKSRLKNAKELGETSLMFLVHPTLTTEEMNLMGSAISQVLSNAQKSTVFIKKEKMGGLPLE